MRPHVLLATLLLPLPAGADGAPRVEVTGDAVRLGDVARGAPPALASLDLFPAPDPGATIVVRRARVLRRLREAGIRPRTLHIPRRLRIHRPGRVVTEPELEALMRSALAGRVPPGHRLVSVDVSGGVALEPGDVEVELDGLPRPHPGRQTLWAHLRAGGSRRRLAVTLRLERARGGVETPAVVRGQTVTLTLRGDALRILTKAEAQESGALGTEIAVLPRGGRRILRARVVGAGAVEVWP